MRRVERSVTVTLVVACIRCCYAVSLPRASGLVVEVSPELPGSFLETDPGMVLSLLHFSFYLHVPARSLITCDWNSSMLANLDRFHHGVTPPELSAGVLICQAGSAYHLPILCPTPKKKAELEIRAGA